MKILSWLGLVAVIVFHGLGNEFLFELRIGWFSYYMIALGCVYFLPESFLWVLGRILTWPVLRFSTMCSPLVAALQRRGAGIAVATYAIVSLAAAAGIASVGFLMDLPGSGTVCSLVAFSVVFVTAASFFRRGFFRGATRYLLGATLATALMWASVTLSMVRFDYYDRVGAFHQNRGGRQAAIEAYEKAIRYVPIGRRNPPRKDSGQAASPEVARGQDSGAVIVDGNP